MSIARVLVDVSLPHLDRLFDYSIPQKYEEQVKPGVRVRVRFSGRLVDGYVIELADKAAPGIKPAPLSTIVSSEQVLSPEQYELARAVAVHYGGVLADVIRLAVVPRHATTEKAAQRQWPAPKTNGIPSGGLLEMPAGAEFLQRLREGNRLRAHWLASPVFRPENDWITGFIQAIAATLETGRGVIVVVPDAKDVERLRQRMAKIVGTGAIAQLHSNLGKSARYRNYLAVSRGQAKIVIGTRACVYAPMHDLGLICLWDDGDDLLREQRAPYPHARDVAALRANLENCALLFASHARTAEMQAWLNRGWLIGIERDPGATRKISPAVRAAVDSDIALERDPAARLARIPLRAVETIRIGLTSGPVLVQVARAGYLPTLICDNCRQMVRCFKCNGPVGMKVSPNAGRQLVCSWCATLILGWKCPNCHSTRLRAPAAGSARTAEELGRAFPGHRIISSSGNRIIESVDENPSIVVATPGAEPVAEFGYSAAVLLDGDRMLSRPDLRAGEETLRRWLNAVSLVRQAADGGTVCVVGENSDRAVQSLVQLDPAKFAVREFRDRVEAGFPPAKKMVRIQGSNEAVSDFAKHLPVSGETVMLGPVPLQQEKLSDEQLSSLLISAPLTAAGELVKNVKATAAARSAKKQPAVRVEVDPEDL